MRHEPRITGTYEPEFSGASLAHGVGGVQYTHGGGHAQSLEKHKDITSLAADKVTVNESLKPFDDKAVVVIAADLRLLCRSVRLARLLNSSTRSLVTAEDQSLPGEMSFSLAMLGKDSRRHSQSLKGS